MIQYNSEHILKEVANAFGFQNPFSIDPIGDGLINLTFKIADKNKALIIQRLNGKVFSSPTNIIDNYYHIAEQLETIAPKLIPAPVRTIKNNKYYCDKEGALWRATVYFPNLRTKEGINSIDRAYKAAFSFGHLTKCLSGLEDSLRIIIPGFHDLSLRYQQFSDAINTDADKRKRVIKNEIEQLVAQKQLVIFFNEIRESSEYKHRIMHHDAKLSNILFDVPGRDNPIIVDLDTCQPGYFFSDMGDMMRSMVTTHNEESKDLSHLDIRPEIYHALMSGYLSALGNDLTSKEKLNIHRSGPIMIYMQALRFLTDHLNGDRYYKIEYPDHNLLRGRNQLQLFVKLQEYIEKSSLMKKVE